MAPYPLPNFQNLKVCVVFVPEPALLHTGGVCRIELQMQLVANK